MDAPSHQLEEFSPSIRQVTQSLDGFPLQTISRLEGQTLSIWTANRQPRPASAALKAEAISLFWLESGAWKQHPEWKQASTFAAPGGVPVKIEVDQNGDLVEAAYPGHKIQYLDYTQVNGVRTPRQRIADGSRWDLESVQLAAPTDSPTPSPQVHLVTAVKDLPLAQNGGNVMLSGNVGGEDCTFLIDSGSITTLLDRDWADKLGWPVKGTLRLPTSMWDGQLHWTHTGPFDLGPLKIDPMNVMCLKLNPSRMGENLGGVRGLVACDILSQTIVQLDYPAKRIRFFSQGYQPDAQDREIPVNMEAGLPMVEMKVNSKSHHFLLDTGSGTSLCVPNEAGLVSPAAEKFYDPGGVRFVVGTAGGWPGRANLAMGPFLWKSAPIAVIDQKNAQGLVVNGPGVIGYGFLRHFRVTLDLGHSRMWLAQGLPFRDILVGTYGFNCEVQEGKVQVVSLIPKGPAAQKGLKIGDTIVACNGLNFESVGHLTSDDFLTSPGEVVELTIRRGQKEFPIKIRAVLCP